MNPSTSRGCAALRSGRTALFALALVSALPARAEAPCAELASAVDLSQSPLDDRRVFCTYAKDLVVGACCQSSLKACLLAHPDCPRAKVLAEVGLGTISTGATEEAALAAAAHYVDGLAWNRRAKLDLAGAPCRGSGDIEVVEFSDFDCPHCAAAQGTVEKLLAQRPRVKLCVLAFPIHPHAELAAAAALYAARRDKYWEMSKVLYATQAAREGLPEGAYVDALVDEGKGVGLDPKGLRAALKGGPELDLAQAQRAQALALKVDGTPTFFIAGREVDRLSLSFLLAAVDDEAAWRRVHPPPR